MTSLLILAAVVLLGVAVWQLTKIFDLTQVGSHPDDISTEIANEKDNNINGYLTFAFLGFIYIFTIFCLVEYGSFPLMDNPASEHGKEVDNLMWISMGLIFIVQIFTQFLLHYFAFQGRGVKGRKARFFSDNDKLEALWTIIPVITLSGLILYGLFAWNDIMFVDEEEDVLIVEVYAKQFGWDVRYSGTDNTLGKANVRFIEGVNLVGVDMSDPNAADDKMAKELHLPKGKKVVLKFRSQDVLHSAYLPHFRAQMNCVPGMVTQFAFVPTLTTDEMRAKEGIIKKVSNINEIRADRSKELIAKGEEALDPYTFDYLLLCNKICGASHYNMQMKVVVETPEEFNAWLKELPTLKEQVMAEKAANAPAPAVQEVPAVTDSVATEAIAQVVK
ncbi:cytochrome c oxidase subunit II [Myroides marinus]|jgi:cytochrome c oxidase subunit 2|uniref:cytochrome-c oxidase n=1 Tax=Myroides marinus TaxID=703342 RepID=A0A163W7C9_9FLAO|nr:cytochrome c oxidase subunit II [Myroides marinus]KUF41943.1 cytochrome C oxidase subunit II [Myroides marinus]KZE75970.1 cytochrome C oxidase subunit II [Myroides marinus]MDM1347467.1 cytochrome c oxidase subunit II [Myroides marinus]MDM1351024.1 cytochrome c oxidase subunit II [Myroides marinus]MDM1355308.1 cytochrome c oxidase subunit II [Myroides marinus]